MTPDYIVKLPPVTKKNHQRILKNGRGQPFVAPSQQYQDYAKAAAWFLRPAPASPIDYPCNVRCLFFLPTRRKTDLTNLLESIDDIMMDCGILADDNYNIVAGHDGSRCYVDRENPRTEIYIERMDDDERSETQAPCGTEGAQGQRLPGGLPEKAAGAVPAAAGDQQRDRPDCIPSDGPHRSGRRPRKRGGCAQQFYGGQA